MHLIPNPRAYQALDGAFTLQDGEKVKSELRIPLVRTTTREARIIVTRNPALQKEAYRLGTAPQALLRRTQRDPRECEPGGASTATGQLPGQRPTGRRGD